MLVYTVKSNQYHTVKEVLTSYFQISNRLLVKLKKAQKIYLNDLPCYVTAPLSLGDKITVDIYFNETSENILPTKMDLQIVYEDDALLILNKPAGIPVHPSMLHYENTLSNGVQYYLQEKKEFHKIRPVNRLDKNTSGLVVFAKNEYIQESLVQQMKNKIFIKEYQAILEGHLKTKSGTIHAAIRRKPGSIMEREIATNGATAITHYVCIQNFMYQNHPLCFVKFQLETGRTHQIRLHSQYIGHPILGDDLYGNASPFIARQALHAFKIKFIHPISQKRLCFEIPLPEDMKIIQA